jgi:hypothetical protein
MGGKRMATSFRSVNFKGGKDSSGDIGVNCMTIFKRILDKYDAKIWIGFNWHKIGYIGELPRGGVP